MKNIQRPTKEVVQDYLDKWETLQGYPKQEKALKLLFCDTFSRNNNLSEVLLKCSTLNDFYGTNIFNIFPLANHIINLNIDDRLIGGDPHLPNEIALGHGIRSKAGNELQLFSFATKYCSHHNPKDFPIFDSFVEKLLVHFKKTDNFSDFSNKELRDYTVFKKVILDFQKVYQLEDFNLKEIDKYLWQQGKEAFPKKYGKKEKNNGK